MLSTNSCYIASVPKVLFPAAISFFLECFYVANFTLRELLLLQQFTSILLLTNSTASDLRRIRKQSLSHFKGNSSEHFPGRQASCRDRDAERKKSRRKGRKTTRKWVRFTQNQLKRIYFFPQKHLCNQGHISESCSSIIFALRNTGVGNGRIQFEHCSVVQYKIPHP